jgi:hypothetical protein
MPLLGKGVGLVQGSIPLSARVILRMQLSHAVPVRSAVFSEGNQLACSGLVPVIAFAGGAGLPDLADERLTCLTVRVRMPGRRGQLS